MNTHDENEVRVLSNQLLSVLSPALMEAGQASTEFASVLYMLEIRLWNAKEWHIDDEAK